VDIDLAAGVGDVSGRIERQRAWHHRDRAVSVDVDVMQRLGRLAGQEAARQDVQVAVGDAGDVQRQRGSAVDIDLAAGVGDVSGLIERQRPGHHRDGAVIVYVDVTVGGGRVAGQEAARQDVQVAVGDAGDVQRQRGSAVDID